MHPVLKEDLGKKPYKMMKHPELTEHHVGIPASIPWTFYLVHFRDKNLSYLSHISQVLRSKTAKGRGSNSTTTATCRLQYVSGRSARPKSCVGNRGARIIGALYRWSSANTNLRFRLSAVRMVRADIPALDPKDRRTRAWGC
ncbi:hypothetical protein FHG87_019388 [Trinorchestia longiramus]|nr:hypothetical protein FHG87_019388 [Trinorchestia longiramus]